MKREQSKESREKRAKRVFLFFSLFSALFALSSCASTRGIRAEEYFTIGMAYYELGQNTAVAANRERFFREAERWLNMARSADRTMVASEYNLGRIAFETGRFETAARHFERILVRDPDNVMALRAAAFSRIKNGDLDKAVLHYDRVLELVPESADDGFNHALVLFAMNRFADSEAVLLRFPFALEERAASVLLLARAQKAQNRTEAVDTYARWVAMVGTPTPQGLHEYALVLEAAGFYALALEQYQRAIDSLEAGTGNLQISALRFEKARLLLTVDPENPEGIAELKRAVSETFTDTAAKEALLLDTRITQANREEIRRILTPAPPEPAETLDEETGLEN